ncbi:BA75_00280T0 [Komagataella pastoris]|uniref:Transcription initiation factor TFIID subunit 4 n=1 Tax=Komagataella pastoris TaxID=4922 RepID=A0A1B2J658_PICPA|nr:BA75_00280T0 [Komagataella pastoris]
MSTTPDGSTPDVNSGKRASDQIDAGGGYKRVKVERGNLSENVDSGLIDMSNSAGTSLDIPTPDQLNPTNSGVQTPSLHQPRESMSAHSLSLPGESSVGGSTGISRENTPLARPDVSVSQSSSQIHQRNESFPGLSVSKSSTSLNKDTTFDNRKRPLGNNGANPNAQKSSDPEKLSDALTAAGVDLKEEESLLSQSTVIQQSRRQLSTLSSFLHPVHLATFMRRVMENNGLRNYVDHDTELLSYMSSACEGFMAGILTDSVLLANHRKRPIKSKLKHSTTPRSDVSKVLRDIATKQKEREEQRVQKRVTLDIEGQEDDGKSKQDNEEVLHRAANATAMMMTSKSKKKKYSWMNADSGAQGGKTNSVLARGDSGIRYRDAREEPGLVLRDLLGALEGRRMCVANTVVKGYARMND